MTSTGEHDTRPSPPDNARPWRGRHAGGFALVEWIVVGLLLAILLVLVAPRLVEATDTRQPDQLYDQLQTLRTAILVYRSEHNNIPPGFPKGDMSAQPTYEVFVTQLTRYSDDQGNTSTVGGDAFPFGPYVHTIPKNAVNQQTGIRFIPAEEPIPPAPVGTKGWLYHAATGAIVANAMARPELQTGMASILKRYLQEPVR